MLHSAWDRLISAATLGTSRAPVALQDVWPHQSVAHEVDSAERAFLRAAAATYLWDLAGKRAGINTRPPLRRPAPPAEPHVDEAAAWRLARMITGEHRDLIPEWLDLAAAQQLTVPLHWLP